MTTQPSDQLAADAQAVSAVVSSVLAKDPTLATKVLLLTRSPPGVLAVTVIVWLAARYGLQLDPTVVDAVSAVAVLLGGYAFRAITRVPVSGLVKPPAAPTTALGLVLLALSGFVLGACSPAEQAKLVAAAATPSGQLFCYIHTAGGGDLVAGLVDAEASAAAPGAGPVAVIATGMAKADVDAICAAAGKAKGGTGTAVSPPLDPAVAPLVAVALTTLQSTVKP